jgi:hypothetical protein
MVGSDTQLNQAISPENTEERRVRVRYPVSLQTTVRPADGEGPELLSARVRNISRGGINLLLDEPLDPGGLLSVELPDAHGGPTHAVLACIIHASPHGEGQWAVGCTFSRELGDTELNAFQPRREKPKRADDQRGWVRFALDVRVSCRSVATAEEPWIAQVLDVSPSGIGLLADRAVENGTLLNVEFPVVAQLPPLNILACVVHITERDPGRWAMGCNFIRELTDAELRALR